ncbi:guanylate kinase isoform X1 [Zerene cesonia]|uniref:guanylate kinase isoform X1 n=1 Tax=Zerene cesonia TaxID=33412 RepID=UPI0018E55377|nr:guanylate kinase isoform X1 [Zerene cesonia]
MVQKGPRPLVLCGPSGSGKSTLLKRLQKEFPDKFGFSVSHTTRGPRPGEKDGVHYHFTTRDNLLAAVEKGEFIETAIFSGNLYGTSKKAVEDVRLSGRICVLDIEIEGVKQIKRTDLDPLLVFVMPPSMDELERRLRNRNTEQEEALQKRLETARHEIKYGQEPGNFHIVILNDSLDKAYAELRDFIIKNADNVVEDNARLIPCEENKCVHFSSYCDVRTHMSDLVLGTRKL